MKHKPGVNESGQALILVMMILLLFLVIGYSLLNRSSNIRKVYVDQIVMTKTYYIAEAGIEKVLANIKNNTAWLKECEYNKLTPYQGGLSIPYGDGQLTGVAIKRTSKTNNPTGFYIESQGKFLGASRTLQVEGLVYESVDYTRGVWLKSPLSRFGHNCDIRSNIVVPGDVYLTNKCVISGTLLSMDGDIYLYGDVVAGKIVAGRNVLVGRGVSVTGDITAQGNVVLEEDAQVNGEINAVGNVFVADGAIVGYIEKIGQETLFYGKDIYYNGIIEIYGYVGNCYHGIAHYISEYLPAFPVPDYDWFARNADRTIPGYISGSLIVDGVSFTEGDVTLSGIYTGTGAIVAGGTVTICHDLIGSDAESSLAVIAYGDPQGIVIANNINVSVLLYATGKINIGSGSNLSGSIVCDNLQTGENVRISFAQNLAARQPEWITTNLKIVSWKERYSIF